MINLKIHLPVWTFALLLSMLSFDSLAHTLAWAKVMGGGRSNATGISVDSSGTAYITGQFSGTVDMDPGTGVQNLTSAGHDDIFIAKYSASGDYIWAKRIGGASSEATHGIVHDPQGNIYITGFFHQSVNFDPGGGNHTLTASGADAFLAKYDANGNYVWAFKIGDIEYESGRSIARDPSGNIIIGGSFKGTVDFNPAAGTANLTSIGAYDYFLAKYDADGQYLWARNWGRANQNASVTGISVDASGNIFLSGNVSELIHEREMILAKYNAAGVMQWNNILTASNGGQVYGNLSCHPTGGFYIAATFTDTVDFDPGTGSQLQSSAGRLDLCIARYDTDGKYIWSKRIGGLMDDGADHITVDKTGTIYITGAFGDIVDFDPGPVTVPLTAGGNFNPDMFVAKYDPNGDFVWAGSIGSPSGGAYSYGIVLDTGSQAYIAGMYYAQVDFDPGPGVYTLPKPVSNTADIFMMKLDFGGCVATYSSITASHCSSYSFNNKTYTASGVFVDTFANAAGCDSLVRISLTIGNSLNPEVTGVFCDSATFNGITYRSSGIYNQTYTNRAGCDSTIRYNLTIHPGTSSTITARACDSFVFAQSVYRVTGVYTVPLFSNANSCDSTVILDLTINGPKAFVTSNGPMMMSNQADSYQWYDCNAREIIPGETGQQYTATATGSYAVIVSANGCIDTADCIVIDDLTSVEKTGKAENGLKIFPNPTRGIVRIASENSLHDARIALCNLQGQMLRERLNQQGEHVSLDISDIADGIYMLVIQDRGQIYRTKLIKNQDLR